MTPFENKCEILGDLWMEYRDDAEFEDFIEYNDIGLPLAYYLSNKIVAPTTIAQQFIEETWTLFLNALEISEDTGFDNLDELLNRA